MVIAYIWNWSTSDGHNGREWTPEFTQASTGLSWTRGHPSWICGLTACGADLPATQPPIVDLWSYCMWRGLTGHTATHRGSVVLLHVARTYRPHSHPSWICGLTACGADLPATQTNLSECVRHCQVSIGSREIVYMTGSVVKTMKNGL